MVQAIVANTVRYIKQLMFVMFVMFADCLHITIVAVGICRILYVGGIYYSL